MRKAFASTKFPHDPVKGAAIIAANYDRSFYPEGTARQWAAILATPPRTEALKKLHVPALVLHGSSDTLIHPDAGRHTAASIPGATLRIIDGWGHDMPHSAMPVLLRRSFPSSRASSKNATRRCRVRPRRDVAPPPPRNRAGPR